uniref:Thioredoxin family protein n=1 Tax=Tetraselmis sp. GSL018 TaxID=582737 RepID=A0A061RRT2_9CHLO
MVRSLFSTAYLPSFDTVTRRSFSRQRSKEIRPSVKIASEAAGRGQDGARKPRSRAFEVATSGLASLSRLPFGTTANAARARDQLNPELFPRLYEFEACPFCRRVREAITDLDLDVIIFPCPKVSTPSLFGHREGW